MYAVQSVVAKLFSQAERYLPTRRLSTSGWAHPPRIDNLRSCAGRGIIRMTDQQKDPLSQFGLDAIDLRWTTPKDIDSKRTWLINEDHLPLGLVEMREGAPCLTTAGQNAAWQG